MRYFTRLILLLLVASFAAGCSDQQDFVVTGEAPEAAASAFVAGRLSFGRFVSEGTATLEALDGTVVAQSKIGATGNFRFSGQTIPPDFRVRCQPAGTTTSFFTEVRNFDGKGRFVVVNVPTSLVSLYLKNHPGEGLDAANERVRRYLKLGSGTDLEYGLSESRGSAFSHLAFFVDAARAGGWATASAQAVTEIEQASTSNQANTADTPAPFAVKRSDLKASLDGLESGLSAHIQPLQTFQPLVLSFVGDAAEEILGSVLESLGESAIDAGKDTLWTTIAEHFGLNFGTTVALDEIEEQLNEIIGNLSTIYTTIVAEGETSAYGAAAGELNSDISFIQALTGVPAVGDQPSNFDTSLLAKAVKSSNQNQLPSNTPISSLPEDMQSLLTALGSFETNVKLLDIQNAQFDRPTQAGLNTLWRQAKVDSILPVQDDNTMSRFMNFPWRANTWLSVALENYTYYGTNQEAAVAWIAQNKRLQPGLAASINSARDTLESAAVSLKAQRGQFPQPLLSDEVLVDLQYGLMWYATMQSPDTWKNASQAAGLFELHAGGSDGNQVVYKDWRLPTYNEFHALQDRARYYAGGYDSKVASNSNTGYGDTGMAAPGLPGLGFLGVADALNSKDSDGDPTNAGLWFYGFGYEKDIDPIAGYIGEGWILFSQGEFEFNHASTIKYRTKSDELNHKYPYLMCRSIGKPLLSALDPNVAQRGDPVPPEGSYPSQLTPADVTPAEFPGLGVPTALWNVGAISDSKVTAGITYTIHLGGEFITGNAVKSTHHSVPTNALAANLSPYDGQINQDPQFNALITVPWFETTLPPSSPSTTLLTVEVSNAPPASGSKSSKAAYQRALNMFGSSGTIFKHTDSTDVQPALLTASVLAYVPNSGGPGASPTFPVIVSKTGDISQPGWDDNHMVRQPTIFQVSPRNRYYDGHIQKISEVFDAALFYSNQTVEAKTTPNVVWSLTWVDANGDPAGSLDPTIAKIDSQTGELQIDRSNIVGSALDLNVTATLTINALTKTDSVRVHAESLIE